MAETHEPAQNTEPAPSGRPVNFDRVDQTSEGGLAILTERLRQETAGGHTPDRDDQHVRGELARAAMFYVDEESSALDWPWAELPAARGDRVADLVKAGALIAAEIDRLLRQKRRGRVDA